MPVNLWLSGGQLNTGPHAAEPSLEKLIAITGVTGAGKSTFITNRIPGVTILLTPLRVTVDASCPVAPNRVIFIKAESPEIPNGGIPTARIRNIHTELRKPTGPLENKLMLLDQVSKQSRLRQKIATEYGLTDLQPPIDVINPMFREYGFKYQLRTDTASLEYQHSFPTPLKLSSGEKKIRDIIVLGYCCSVLKIYSLVILDEPDRHFDPKACKNFYNLINTHMVGAGVQVIMTTHRIDSIALAPPKSIFRVTQDQLLHQCTQLHAMFRMTHNLRALTNFHTKVYVEAPNDAQFYSSIYSILMRYSEKIRVDEAPPGLDRKAWYDFSGAKKFSRILSKRYQLSFISVSPEAKGGGGGCAEVEKMVSRDYESREVLLALDPKSEVFDHWLERQALHITKPFGLIDGDYKEFKSTNPDRQKKFVQLARHSLENYLLDPFFLASVSGATVAAAAAAPGVPAVVIPAVIAAGSAVEGARVIIDAAASIITNGAGGDETAANNMIVGASAMMANAAARIAEADATTIGGTIIARAGATIASAGIVIRGALAIIVGSRNLPVGGLPVIAIGAGALSVRDAAVSMAANGVSATTKAAMIAGAISMIASATTRMAEADATAGTVDTIANADAIIAGADAIIMGATVIENTNPGFIVSNRGIIITAATQIAGSVITGPGVDTITRACTDIKKAVSAVSTGGGAATVTPAHALPIKSAGNSIIIAGNAIATVGFSTSNDAFNMNKAAETINRAADMISRLGLPALADACETITRAGATILGAGNIIAARNTIKGTLTQIKTACTVAIAHTPKDATHKSSVEVQLQGLINTYFSQVLQLIYPPKDYQTGLTKGKWKFANIPTGHPDKALVGGQIATVLAQRIVAHVNAIQIDMATPPAHIQFDRITFLNTLRTTGVIAPSVATPIVINPDDENDKKTFETLCDLVKPELRLQYRMIEHIRRGNLPPHYFGPTTEHIMLDKSFIIELEYPSIFLNIRGHNLAKRFADGNEKNLISNF